MDLVPGVYPAAVSPLDAQGRIDTTSVARLLAYFEAAGCAGAVVAGTNGEGPSFSARQKRDLLRDAMLARGGLRVILGIATSAQDEAVWSCRQAGDLGACAVLLMPPSYFRAASEEGIRAWLENVLDASPVPVILYNFPKMTGVTLSPELIGTLAQRENVVGIKDSSGEAANLAAYRQAVPQGKMLFVGDERLLVDALSAGWTGSISGVANVLPQWLSRVVAEWLDPALRESAGTKFELLRPVIETLRALPQPAANKAILHAFGIVGETAVLPPLRAVAPEEVADALAQIESRLGIAPGRLGLP